MLTCNKLGDRMVVDAPNSNGPFQPVALIRLDHELHFLTILYIYNTFCGDNSALYYSLSFVFTSVIYRT
uniref:Uncharacterized protein n=1 Tax=Periophthalmus magnuspinnatus TaxID=409849 RepID=A0A3B4A840_9GOBI